MLFTVSLVRFHGAEFLPRPDGRRGSRLDVLWQIQNETLPVGGIKTSFLSIKLLYTTKKVQKGIYDFTENLSRTGRYSIYLPRGGIEGWVVLGVLLAIILRLYT